MDEKKLHHDAEPAEAGDIDTASQPTEDAQPELTDAEPETEESAEPMPYEFENAYEITEAVYLDWATHPVGKLAQKRARTVTIMTAAEMAVSLALAIFGAFRGAMLYVIVGGLFALYFAASLTVLKVYKNKKTYRQLLRQHNTSRWHRVMRFGDRIEVNDAGTPTVFDWKLVVTVTQDDRWIYLWLNPSSAYRVGKSSFTKGSPEEFTAFAGRMMKQK